MNKEDLKIQDLSSAPETSVNEWLHKKGFKSYTKGDNFRNVFLEYKGEIKPRPEGNNLNTLSKLKYAVAKLFNIDIEFKIGDTVTLDRYNHIDDVETVKIIDIREGLISKDKVYVMDVNGVEISSSGLSIMESEFYSPVPEEDRHYKIGSSEEEIEEYWKNKRFN